MWLSWSKNKILATNLQRNVQQLKGRISNQIMGSKGLGAKENKKILERLLKSFKFQIFLEEHVPDPPGGAFCSKLGTYLGQIIH